MNKIKSTMVLCVVMMAVLFFQGISMARTVTFNHPTTWQIDYFDEYEYCKHPPLRLHLGEFRDCGYGGQCDGKDGAHHTGIDYEIESGNRDVVAANYGTVVNIVKNGDGDHGLGNTIIIYHKCVGGGHTGPAFTLYGHLRSINVTLGQNVKIGQKIGEIGGTANGYSESDWAYDYSLCRDSLRAWPPHLHFEVKAWNGLRAPYCNGVSWSWREFDYRVFFYYGYTPSSPDQCGYHNPMSFIGQVQVEVPDSDDPDDYQVSQDNDALMLTNPESGNVTVVTKGGNSNATVGDTGTSNGPDGNIKRVELAKEGSENYHHTLVIRPGREFKIETKVTNKGDEDAEDCQIRYYRSTDKTFTSSDYYYGDDDNVNIDDGESVTKHWRHISHTTEGKWYVFTRAICPDDVNSSNNYSRNDDKEEFAVLVIVKPNLLIRSAVIDTGLISFLPGQSATAIVSTYNEGAEPEQDAKLRFYLSSGEGYNNPTILGDRTLPAIHIEHKETRTEYFTFTMPSTPGVYTLSIQADADGMITESSETDNWYHMVINVTAPPLPPAPEPSNYKHISPAVLQLLLGR